MDTAAAAHGRDVNLNQFRGLVSAQFYQLLHWYSRGDTALKERGRSKWLEAKSQWNFLNWPFPYIQRALSTLSRGAVREVANSSYTCNALTLDARACAYI